MDLVERAMDKGERIKAGDAHERLHKQGII
jgi:hypothetical protein